MSYLDDLADAICSEAPELQVPSEDAAMLFRMYAVLLLGLGTSVRPADVHNAWVAWMSERQPDHPSLVPYDELPSSVAREDDAYVEAIHRVARWAGTDPALR